MKKLIYFLLFFLLISIFGVSAQEQPVTEEISFEPPLYRYDLGDQIYSLSAGPLINLFIWSPEETTPIDTGSMKLGGYVSLGWEAFLDHKSSVGVELGYGFARSLDTSLYLSIPALARVSYYLLEGNIDLPVSFSAGGIYSSYDDQHYFGVMVKPEISVYWNINDEWGVGLKTAYWFIPELYFGENSSKTSYANFLSIQATVKYTQ
ncbi:MAG: hypothetical protein K8S00_06165 [Bacteroidales bacterium]|nr:hypothetical protein [Bacteroidales bacterium]